MLETVLQPLIAWVTRAIGDYGLLAVFGLMSLESMGVLIPSEAISPFAGYLVSQGKLGLPAAVGAGVLGISQARGWPFLSASWVEESCGCGMSATLGCAGTT